MGGSGIAIHSLLCSRHFSSSIIQNLVPFARGNMPHMGPENPIKALLLVYYNNKFCSQSKRKPPNKRTKNKENFLAVLYVFSTVKQALVRIFGFSLPALPDPVIFFAKRGWTLSVTACERSEPERIRFPQRRAFAESGAANAAFRYDPSREKAFGALRRARQTRNYK
ncbi:hypothetical protein [Faecalibacterium sp. 9]|jgi:hypothetical protein|uniref:hypothetical protein n=1 Tax=Faecalibacterium sp. 9 TaxID=3402018 RepID=UPI003AADA324